MATLNIQVLFFYINTHGSLIIFSIR